MSRPTIRTFGYLAIWLFGCLAVWLHARAMSMAKWGIPEKSIKNSSEGLTLGLHEAPVKSYGPIFWGGLEEICILKIVAKVTAWVVHNRQG